MIYKRAITANVCTNEQISSIPNLRFLSTLPVDPPPLDFDNTVSLIENAITTRDWPSPYLHLADYQSVYDPQLVPAPMQRLLNIQDRITAFRRTPHLSRQIYLNERTGAPSPTPFHAHGHLVGAPFWYNYGCGSSFGPSFDYQLLGLVMKQASVGSQRDFLQLTALVHRFQDIDQAYQEEAIRQNTDTSSLPPFHDDHKRQIIREAERIESCFSPDATDVMTQEELQLEDPPGTPEISVPLDRFESQYRTDVSSVAGFATAARLENLQRVLDELECVTPVLPLLTLQGCSASPAAGLPLSQERRRFPRFVLGRGHYDGRALPHGSGGFVSQQAVPLGSAVPRINFRTDGPVLVGLEVYPNRRQRRAHRPENGLLPTSKGIAAADIAGAYEAPCKHGPWLARPVPGETV